MTDSHPRLVVQPALFDRSVGQVVRLFDAAAAEAAVIDRLAVCVADLRCVQQAKAELATVDADTLRAALLVRHRARSDGQSGGAGR